MSVYRSILFVPATRPERIAKAFATAADLVCIDLEDAVAPHEKSAGRANVVDFLGGADVEPGRCMVRINSPRTDLGRDDLQAIGAPSLALPYIMVPKVEGPTEIDGVGKTFGERSPNLVALIESAEGLAAVEDIARGADRGVVALAFGSADYGAQVGCADSWDALAYARGRIVAAAALGGIPALDGVWFDIEDVAGLSVETGRIKSLGFAGKLAIHPRQVDPINAAFRPTPEAVDRARRIVEASAEGRTGVTVVDGHMVDAPVIAMARRVLDLAALYEAT